MFDNVAELIDKIRLGEDSYLELKEVRLAGQKVSAPHKDSLADELAAFANSRGGVCLLGVDDRREVLGISLERLDLVEDFVRQICLDSISPPLTPLIGHNLSATRPNHRPNVLRILQTPTSVLHDTRP